MFFFSLGRYGVAKAVAEREKGRLLASENDTARASNSSINDNCFPTEGCPETVVGLGESSMSLAPPVVATLSRYCWIWGYNEDPSTAWRFKYAITINNVMTLGKEGLLELLFILQVVTKQFLQVMT